MNRDVLHGSGKFAALFGLFLTEHGRQFHKHRNQMRSSRCTSTSTWRPVDSDGFIKHREEERDGVKKDSYPGAERIVWLIVSLFCVKAENLECKNLKVPPLVRISVQNVHPQPALLKSLHKVSRKSLLTCLPLFSVMTRVGCNSKNQ